MTHSFDFESVKCLEKKVKDSYYIVCQDCCVSLKVCSKCSKSCENIEYAHRYVLLKFYKIKKRFVV